METTHGRKKNTCVGYNVDPKDCKALGSLPLSIKVPGKWFKYLNLLCHNCSVGFKGDFFFEYTIDQGEFVRIAGGFRNGVVHANFGIEVDDVALNIRQFTKQLPGFTVPIEFFGAGSSDAVIRMEASLTVNLEGTLDLAVPITANAGYTVQYNHGDDYFVWNKKTGRERVSNLVNTASITPYYEAKAPDAFTISGELALPVALNLEVQGPFFRIIQNLNWFQDYDAMFKHTTALTPRVSMQLTGERKSRLRCPFGILGNCWYMCAKADFDTTLSTSTVLQYPLILRGFNKIANKMESFSFWPETLKKASEFLDGTYTFHSDSWSVINKTSLADKCMDIE
jgi:hypothetical protein